MAYKKIDYINWFTDQIAKISEAGKNEIDISAPFMELGLNSLDIIQLSKDFEAWSNQKLQPSILFDYPTIHDLALFLEKGEEAFSYANQAIEYEDIAIIGMSCRFPGANNIEEYWKLLNEGQCAVKEIPPNRLKRKLPFKAYAGLLDEIDKFDNKFFQLSDTEARHMDPQQRILMELSYHALENAHKNPKELSGEKVGVFVGISTSDYFLEKILNDSKAHVFDGTGLAHSIAANRLSYFYNFKGPSFSIDTACSSSLVTIHLACQSLIQNESKLALAGGINIISSPFLTEAFYKAGMLSKTGLCKTFSNQADGYVRGEGGGFVVLKKLSEAKKDNDNILAVIKGSSVTQDGKTNTLTAPSGRSQLKCLGNALHNSKLGIDDIDYIEAHGTGTPLGDPIEFRAINSIYKKRKMKLPIGSVKTNIGHLEAAAGIAGVIKSILSLQNNIVPKQLHYKKINPNIDIDSSRLSIANQPIELDQHKLNRIGISSFGFGGTNAHIIIESSLKSEKNITLMSTDSPLPTTMLHFSSSNEETLVNYAKEINKLIDDYRVEDLSYSLNKKDLLLKTNLFLIGDNKLEIKNQLNEFIQTKNAKNYSQNFNKTYSKKAFVFTGQGSSYPLMGIDLYNYSQTFRQSFNTTLNKFQQYTKTNLLNVWKNSKGHENNIYETFFAQIFIFTYEISLFELLTELNIIPDILIGHSLGEISAIYCSKMISLDDAVKLVFKRSQAMERSSEGAMVHIQKDQDFFHRTIEPKYQVELATINSQNSIVLSGKKFEIDKLIKFLEQENITHKRLKIFKGFHSSLMDDIVPQFVESIKGIQYNDPLYPIISCFTCQYLKASDLNNHFWGHHLRSPTRFFEAMNEVLKEKPQIIVEVGPIPQLSPIISQYKFHFERPLIIKPTSKKNKNWSTLLESIAKLKMKGVEIDLNYLTNNRGLKMIPLPQMIFSKDHFWTKSNEQNAVKNKKVFMRKQKKTIEQIKEELINIVHHDLEIPRTEIDTDSSLMDLGTDSLVLLNCLENINERYKTSISVTDIFQDLSNIRQISEFLFNSEENQHIETNESFQNTIEASNLLEISSQSFYKPQKQTSNSEKNLQELINEQLEIMKMQLAVMGSNTQVDSTFSVQSKQVSPFPKKNKKYKSSGVLDNFNSSFNSKDDSQFEKEKEDYLNKLINDFSKKTQQSKLHTEKFRNPLADNRVSAGFRPNLKEIVYPIQFQKSKGAYFYDIDNNKYIDFSMGFGVNLFGHNPDFINDAIKKQIDEGMALGPQFHLAGDVANLFCELTGFERVAFVNSGTEAIMTAIRLARAKTQRKTFVVFEGSYHGHFDGVLGKPNLQGKTVPVAPGVSTSIEDDLIVLEYGEKTALDYLKENGHLIAGVLVETVQSRHPELQPREFIKKLREITKTSETALIFDEVINGFRVTIPGSSQDFEVKPDLATYGKILGGGMPIGAVTGDSKYLDFIDGGKWEFGNQSMPLNPLTFFAGTFCKHPLSMVATFEVLKKLKNEGKELLNKLNQKTEKLKIDLNQWFSSVGVNLKIVSYGSLFRFYHIGNIDWLIYKLNLKGFYIWEGRNLFLSTAHSDEDISSFVNAIKEVVSELVQIGYLKGKSQEIAIKNTDQLNTKEKLIVPMIEPQLRFSNLTLTNDIDTKRAAQITIGVKFIGPLNIELLKESISSAIEAHDIFHAHFDLEKNNITFNYKKREVDIDVIDLESIEENESILNDILEKNSSLVLDPNDSPIHVGLIKLKSNETLLTLIIHHLVSDGLSLAFLTDDISKLYSSKASLKTIKQNKQASFCDYLQHYPNRIKQLDSSQVFWKEEAKKWVKPELKLQTKGFQGKRIKRVIPPETYKKIRMFGYKNKSSLLITLLNSFFEQLEILTNQKTLTLGIPAAGHQSINQSMVGQCVNILPLTFKRNDNNLKENIKNLKDYQLQLFKHSDYPYEKMIKDTGLDPINILFNVEPISELPKFHDLDVDLALVPIKSVEYPLLFNIMRINDVLHIEMDYQLGLFNEKDAKEFIDNYINLLLKSVS